jgi:AraC family transcriptional regulator of adaptative response / DNA-3-methyladenine glycosylase II
MPLRVTAVFSDARRFSEVEVATDLATARILQCSKHLPGPTTRALLAIRGIGPWTCAYVAMRTLGSPDAFPDGDLGLRRALGVKDIVARAEAWRPWRAYAAMHLWTSDARPRPSG